ncbi:phage tail sheath C-terminal domain-containing protein [Sodalis endosymbiont of Spalangia cameroni]|uniref:phage tail sheath C-terminal domain-containing protein n=1 Tax=Sodalis praecaptivus TaxID=1239307 RepID=UPI0031F9668A
MSIDAVIPTPTYKPGYYFGFNTTLASRALATNDQKLVILAQRTTTPDTDTLTPVNVFSDEAAASLFGRGSQAHRMARAAIRANDTLQLAVVGIPDSEAGVAATGTLGLKGSASGTGQVRLGVCGETVAIAVASGDSAGALMVSLVEAINTLDALPVTAAMADIPPPSSGGKSPGKQLVLTARNKGTCGNQIGVAVTLSAPGITATLTPMRGGEGDPALDAALAAIFSAGHTLVMSPYASKTALTTLAAWLDKVSGPLEQRGALGVVGWNGTLAGGTALTTDVNAARLTMGWYPGSMLPNGELAAIYAAIIASESDPARPLNTLALPGADITPQDQWPGRSEQENALANGLTPFEVNGSQVQIVRAVSTYVKNSMGVTDRSLMDITILRSLDYVRLACRARITQRFPREKLNDIRLQRIRSELLDVLYALEQLEIVENVDEHKDQLTVTRSQQDDSRADASIPAAVVRGLHVFAATIYLL